MNDEKRMSSVRKAAIALKPQIREAAAEIEEGRRLPRRIVEAMKRAGVFGIAMPREWGGSELDLPEQLRVLEILSQFDGSVGWCATIGSAGGLISSWLPDEAPGNCSMMQTPSRQGVRSSRPRR